MGICHIHVDASRNQARALDAARRWSPIEGYEPSFEIKGQRLTSQLEPPV